MSTGVIFILDKGVSPILASGVRSTLAPGVIRAWVFHRVLLCAVGSCRQFLESEISLTLFDHCKIPYCYFSHFRIGDRVEFPHYKCLAFLS